VSTVLRRGAVLAVLLAALISCRPGDDAAHPRASGVGTAEDVASVRTDADGAEVVRFAFHPEPALRPAFDSVFGALSQRRRAAPELSEATLHHFAVDSAEQRYVLLAKLIPSEGVPMGQWGWAFIAIERDGVGWHLSRAYDFKAEENLAVVGIRDVDGDGSADVIYCAWYEGQDELVPAGALGYKNHHWYPMDVGSPGAVNHDCRAASDASARAEAATDSTGSDR
jgi:hypothetical protein